MRVKVQYRTASKEAYNKFCSKHPDIKLSFIEWKEIIYVYNSLFRDYILDTGDKAKLPWGLGAFSISKKKTKKLISYNGKEYINLAVDWKRSRAAGKKIYHFNNHTDGYRFKWMWFRSEARFYQSEIWIFKACRESSRKIAQYINKPSSMYPQIYKQWQRK